MPGRGWCAEAHPAPPCVFCSVRLTFFGRGCSWHGVAAAAWSDLMERRLHANATAPPRTRAYIQASGKPVAEPARELEGVADDDPALARTGQPDGPQPCAPQSRRLDLARAGGDHPRAAPRGAAEPRRHHRGHGALAAVVNRARGGAKGLPPPCGALARATRRWAGRRADARRSGAPTGHPFAAETCHWHVSETPLTLRREYLLAR